MKKNIGFVSTRFSGADGVTLESSKWSEVFQQNGYNCFWFAGELDRSPEVSFSAPEAHFAYDKNLWINSKIFGRKEREPIVTRAIHELRALLKQKLHAFITEFGIDILIAENVLSIPMHVPLGLALTETIAETQTRTIAHHHDFFWERVRFTVNAVNEYLCMSFPPNLPNIQHVVINSDAQEQLALRTGISSTIIPNVLNFENPPNANLDESRKFLSSIGLEPQDRMILQPTRVVQRKGIESAIDLVKALDDPRNKLVISHEAGDEGYDYLEYLEEYAHENRVDLRLVDTRIADPFCSGLKNPCPHTLWDVYPHADFITYPSLCEGFGNAFLEAIYFKKPMLINRYATFVRDIEPQGFDLAVMDGILSKKTIQTVRNILNCPEKRKSMVENNYHIALKHYSYTVLKNRLNAIINSFFDDGDDRFSLVYEFSDSVQLPEASPSLFPLTDPEKHKAPVKLKRARH